jgi:hypothetical protein
MIKCIPFTCNIQIAKSKPGLMKLREEQRVGACAVGPSLRRVLQHCNGAWFSQENIILGDTRNLLRLLPLSQYAANERRSGAHDGKRSTAFLNMSPILQHESNTQKKAKQRE